MNPGVPENNNDAPIYVSSGESSMQDELSNVSCQTEQSAVENVNQPAKMVYYGEKESIKAIEVPFAVSPPRFHNAQRAAKPSAKRNDNDRRASPEPSTNRNYNAPRASLQQSINSQGGTNNMPNETPGVQAQGVDVSLSTQVSGLRRSARKRNHAIYNEDLLANRLPRLSRPKGATIKKKQVPFRCLRMRASNHYPFDRDLDDSEPDSE